MKFRITCDYCGKEMFRTPCQIKKHNFCSRDCMNKFSSKKFNPEGYKYRSFEKNSKRFSEMNKIMNPTRMTMETRLKISEARTSEKAVSYQKTLGVHTHRVVAERMLGRKLRPGEVVHHIDRNKRNNAPENLMVFASQAEHAAWHKDHDCETEVMK